MIKFSSELSAEKIHRKDLVIQSSIVLIILGRRARGYCHRRLKPTVRIYYSAQDDFEPKCAEHFDVASYAWVERFDRRGTEPFELFRSEFGQNSWNPKKTTKSTVAKRTTSTKQHPTQNTRRGRTNGKKRETSCTEGARRTTSSHRSQRCYTGHQKMLCLKFER